MRAKEFGHVIKDTIKHSADDDIIGLASQAAFSFAFSLFPTLLLLVALLGVIGQYPEFTSLLSEYLAEFLPEDSLSIITSYIASLEVTDPKGLLSLSILLTLWPASGVVSAYIKAVNRAYDAPEDRPFWKKRLIAILIVLLSGILVLTAFLAMVFGPVALEFLSRNFNVSHWYSALVDWLRFPMALIFISTAFALLYRFAPNVEHRWYEILPGALLGCWIWVTITFSFSLYVEQFGRYNKTYGSLGGVIILLTWMFLTSLTVIVGAEFNSAFGRWMRKGKPRPGQVPHKPIDEPRS